jgi:FtsZ-binding cell division protein ZapB
MTEQELKNLIGIYQQKTTDLMSQCVAIEAKLMHSNQLIELLTNRVNELKEENRILSEPKVRKTKAKENFT